MREERVFRRLPALAGLLLAGCALLSGCSPVEDAKTVINIFNPDTSSMNAERFREETRPVFHYGPTSTVYSSNSSSRFSDPLVTGSVMSEGYSTPGKMQDLIGRYGILSDDGHTLPAIPFQRVDPRFYRQQVSYQTNEPVGTIVVDTKARFLYLVQEGGMALRYGIGIGKEGYAWTGRGTIRYKQKWPHWTPSDDMVSKNPTLKPMSAANGGLVAGLNNPLGARALYIYRDGQDSLYRVHGTPQWESIGKLTSSGCVRMFNQDVIDLYNRVPDGASIVVM